MPVVSVILNSYNQAQYLKEAVDSVLEQTFRDFELIIIDNGSTDKSPQLLQQYKDHPKIRLLLHTENQSITRRFNEGIAAANGEFISFLYSDDYYLLTKLERQLACFSTLDAEYGVVYSPPEGFNALTGKRWKYGSIGSSGSILKDLFLIYERGQIDMVSPLVRTECYRKYPFHEDIFAEGEAILFRIAMTYKFLFLNEALVVLRDHESNAGKAIKRNFQMTMAAMEKLNAHPDFPRDCEPYLNRYISTVMRNCGWQSVRVGGDVKWARECFAHSIKRCWIQALHPRTLAGCSISLLPARLRALINRLGNAYTRPVGNSVYVKDFGGAIH